MKPEIALLFCLHMMSYFVNFCKNLNYAFDLLQFKAITFISREAFISDTQIVLNMK